ncbi:tetraspanin-32 [Protobothrops mucrosquamatus]|uniref:tetraspanin-32 n=1 Tax=Protobothrops mucrosquamatus TaxID=103944 RepID=UPI0010FB5B0A|nr:tetraspanin-32 [Protobothrops mucrosquamatus]
MGKRSWVRAMKCQLLATSLFIMLLGVSVGILASITLSGKHFTVINSASSGTNSYYRNFHTIVSYVGMCLSIILAMAALMSIAATIKELEGAMAACFFCFAAVFCASGVATYWTVTNSIVVENAMIDVYDVVYEDVRNNISSTRRQDLYSIHKMFLCCGKKSPFGERSSIEDEMCTSGILETEEEDCLQEIKYFLKKHMDIVSVLMTITIFFMIYGMILTSFLWYSIHCKNNLDRKGKYVLAKLSETGF